MREPFRKASVYITLLLILEAITGLLIIVVTAVYQSILSSYLEESERRLLFSYLFNIYIFGFQLVVTFLCSISLWNRLWRRRCTPNIRLMVSVWLFYSCVIIASGFGTLWNVYDNIDVLESSAESSLYRGIDEYYTCPEWKLLWDGLQLRKQCCGVHSYKDWMNAEWMPKPDENCTHSSAKVLAPIACTKRCGDAFSSIANCQANGESYSNGKPIPTLTIDSINTIGCLPVFSENSWKFFYILLGLTLMALKFLIFLCCFTKYILQRQNIGDGCDNGGLTDEEGRPLVMVKYPRNVRCVVIGEDDLASDIAPDIAYCNCDEAAGESCNYCDG
ncbi:Tsp33B [Drosophila busckii]|uniref:Tsp33B n=1 Tax=Drosophila busckii TaxID=30019 RepID=A0A0M4E0H7_DROBS|nr:CD63 antigen [Drosophila busckii]ALC38628.1 Tsp33B [Drosophila busckii]